MWVCCEWDKPSPKTILSLEDCEQEDVPELEVLLLCEVNNIQVTDSNSAEANAWPQDSWSLLLLDKGPTLPDDNITQSIKY